LLLVHPNKVREPTRRATFRDAASEKPERLAPAALPSNMFQ